MFQFISNLTSGAILFLIFLLLKNPQKANIEGNRWLAFFLFTIFLIFMDVNFLANHLPKYDYSIYFLSNFFYYGCAPSLYLSISNYVSLKRENTKTDFLHFIPLFIINLFIYCFFIYQNEKVDSTNATVLLFSTVVTYIFWIQMFTYLILSFIKIQKYQQQLKLFASTTSTIDLQWLKKFLIGIGVLLFFWILDTFIGNIDPSWLVEISSLIGIFMIGYYSIMQERIFPLTEAERDEIIEIIEGEKGLEKKLKLSPEELETLKVILLSKMATDKLYLDDSLSLPKLAKYLDTNVHKLSHLLNEEIGQNFFQFVNSYRVEEAKRLLLNDNSKQLNMVGIAFEAGFNSKSTFNLAFKKALGISPSEFLAVARLKKE